MSKFTIRLVTLAVCSMALIAVPLLTSAHASGSDNPAPPASDTKKEKKKPAKSSSIDDPRFIEGYRTAYATIYDRNDYASAIDQLKALGRDDRADVANLIGYSYRKLGEPRADLAVLRVVAARTGQPRPGAISSQPDRQTVRHRLRGIPLARRRPGKADRHRPRLLSSAPLLQPAQPSRVAPVLFCRIASGNIPAEIFQRVLDRNNDLTSLGAGAYGTVAAIGD
jgi:hypothetical protein